MGVPNAKWLPDKDSNLEHRAPEARALPLSYPAALPHAIAPGANLDFVIQWLQAKKLQQFLNRHVVVSGNTRENALQGADLDRAVTGHYLVMLTVDLGRNANM